MAISATGATQDKIKKSFVESPKRGSNETAQEVLVGNTASDPIPTESAAAQNVIITNLSLTSSVEGNYSFQSNSRRVIIRNRNDLEVRFAFVSGDTATNYITLKAGCVLSLEGLDLTSKTIYLLASANCTIEIMEIYL